MFATLLITCALSAQPAAESLPPDQVAAAIARGQRTKQVAAVSLRASMSPYTVLVQGPFARVQSFAARAAQVFQPAGDIPPELTAPEWTVQVVPSEPVRFLVTPSARHVVLRFKAGGAILQPIAVEPVQHSWTNAFGAVLNSTGLSARFPIPDRPGDIEFVVVSEAGVEVVHTLRAKDRQKVR